MYDSKFTAQIKMANKYDTCTFLDKEGTGVFVAIIMRSVTNYIFFFLT